MDYLRCNAKLLHYILVAVDKLIFLYKACLVVPLRYIRYNASLITTLIFRCMVLELCHIGPLSFKRMLVGCLPLYRTICSQRIELIIVKARRRSHITYMAAVRTLYPSATFYTSVAVRWTLWAAGDKQFRLHQFLIKWHLYIVFNYAIFVSWL